jgi:hypothetical protein
MQSCDKLTDDEGFNRMAAVTAEMIDLVYKLLYLPG